MVIKKCDNFLIFLIDKGKIYEKFKKVSYCLIFISEP